MPKNAHPPRGGQGKKPAVPAASSSKDGAKTDVKATKKGQSAVKAEENKATGAKSNSKTVTGAKAVEQPEEPPKKPDTRTLIGGASWTGKLPLNLLSEVCQKQKWNKPEYTMVRVLAGDNHEEYWTEM
jgi:hypothetical protein